MTLKKITLATLITLVLFGCSIPKGDSAEVKESTPVEFASTKHLTATDDHFDEKMDLWFLAFNYYQSKGYDMETADRMAVEAVEKQSKSVSLEAIASTSEAELN